MRVAKQDVSDDAALFALFRAIAARDHVEISRRLESAHGLASRPIQVAASRQEEPLILCEPFFRR
jgi:hypothetical protein